MVVGSWLILVAIVTLDLLITTDTKGKSLGGMLRSDIVKVPGAVLSCMR